MNVLRADRSWVQWMLHRLWFALGVMGFIAGFAARANAATHEFNIVALEVSGTKFWLPSTFVVTQGDTVILHAVSKIPAAAGGNNIHGLTIEPFKVKALVEDKPQDIQFVADQVGVFQIRCHLHPAHIGGQMIVLAAPKK